MLVRQFLGAQRPHDEQASVWNKAQQIVHPCQGLSVAPLQVVEQKQERSMGAKESTCQSFKQALTLPVLFKWTRRRQVRSFHQQVGQEACHFGEPDRIEGSQCWTKCLCPKPVHDWCVGQFSLNGVAACDSGCVALPCDLAEQFLSQMCLANAYLS